MALCTLEFRANSLNRGKGTSRSMSVLLPDEHPSAAPYPVLYQLGGEGDDHKAWLRNTLIEPIVRDLPLVVVFPDGEFGRYTDWQRSGPAFEQYIIRDVIGTVERYFPVRRDRAGRAIGGLSMGGYGAMKFALKYPHLFCSAAPQSGSYLSAREYMDYMSKERVEFWKYHVYGPESPGGDDDIFALAERADPNALPAIRFDCGVDDILLPAARRLRDHFVRLNIPHEYYEYPGGHDWPYWQAHIHQVIQFHCQSFGIPTNC